MINRAISWLGNAATIGAATIASVSAEDFRLWGVALVGIGATLWASIRRDKVSKIRIIREELELCDTCRRLGIPPNPCPRAPVHRPPNCPKEEKK